jgi:hypothetical protein
VTLGVKMGKSVVIFALKGTKLDNPVGDTLHKFAIFAIFSP